MSNKQRSGGDALPNDFAHGGDKAKAPSNPQPKGVAGETNGSSRGKQGKG